MSRFDSKGRAGRLFAWLRRSGREGRLGMGLARWVFAGIVVLSFLVFLAALDRRDSFIRIDLEVTDVAFQLPATGEEVLPLLHRGARWQGIAWEGVAELGGPPETRASFVAQADPATSLPVEVRPPAHLLWSRLEDESLALRLLAPRRAESPGTERRELSLDLARDRLSFESDVLRGGVDPIELESSGPAPELLLKPAAVTDGSFLELPIGLDEVRFHRTRGSVPTSFVMSGTIAFPNGEAETIEVKRGSLIVLLGRELVLHKAELTNGGMKIGIDGIATDLRVGHGASLAGVPRRQPSHLDWFFAHPAWVEAAVALFGLVGALLASIVLLQDTEPPTREEPGLFARASECLTPLRTARRARLVVATRPRVNVDRDAWWHSVEALRDALEARLPQGGLLRVSPAGSQVAAPRPVVLEVEAAPARLLDALSEATVIERELLHHALADHVQVIAREVDAVTSEPAVSEVSSAG